MSQWVAQFALLVPDYDAGIAFYCDHLGFVVEQDSQLDGDKRWVVLAPPAAGLRDCRLLLARAANDEQSAAIGRQAGGRVGFFLYTDQFNADYARLKAAGVRFAERPRDEPYGRVCVFEDPFGNRWDLLQPVHT